MSGHAEEAPPEGLNDWVYDSPTVPKRGANIGGPYPTEAEEAKRAIDEDAQAQEVLEAGEQLHSPS